MTSSDNHPCTFWLFSQLEFTGDWAVPRVPTLITDGLRQGFGRSAVKEVLSGWLQEHPDLVAPVTVSERVVTAFQPRRHLANYLTLPNGSWVSHLRVHRQLLKRYDKPRMTP